MSDYVRITRGSFQANLYLNELTKAPTRNLIRLVRIARSAPEENEQALTLLRLWSLTYLQTTRQAYKAARQAYESGYVETNPRSRTPGNLTILSENKRLRTEKKRCFSEYRTAQRLFNIINEE